VSYRRDYEEEDEEQASTSPQASSSAPSISEMDVKVSMTALERENSPIQVETEAKEPQEVVSISSSPSESVSSSFETGTEPLESTDGNTTKTRRKRRKTDYSTWTSTPRPASVHNPDVERFIAWAASGKSINANLRSSKDFHNPSILTGLVDMCGVKERGTNIALEKRGLTFSPADRYDALIAAQEAQLVAKLAQQQPGKRTHIDFVKRPSTSGYQGAPEAKRFKR